MEILNKLRNLDAYPKINEDFYSRTLSGGLITIISSIVMLLLFISEFTIEEVSLQDLNPCELSEPTDVEEPKGDVRFDVKCHLNPKLPGSSCGDKDDVVPAYVYDKGVDLSFITTGLYLNAATETKLTVDTSRGETLHINFDVTFPNVACSLLSVDAMDISGEQHYDIRHDITKKRIDHLGNVIESRTDGIGAPKIDRPLQRHGGRLEQNEKYCGSCYGAEVSDDECCNSCEEVREAYRKKGWGLTNPDLIDQCKREGFVQKIKEEEGEGCNIHGFVEVNKVAGNFHFAPGKSFHQSNIFLGDLLVLPNENFNISHKINKLSFGKEFPGVINPLDG
ncbi:hypothetical protein ACLOJK_024940 [Asimina triloba]